MKKTKNFISEFKAFIARGNVMDMAVGVIIGAAFKAIIDSFVSDIVMPILGVFTGGIDFSNLFISLDGKKYETLSLAQEAGAATINYGVFITAIINFLIMAFVIFCMVKTMNSIVNKAKAPEEPKAPTTKMCPYCKSEISIEATKCPHCTSDLK